MENRLIENTQYRNVKAKSSKNTEIGLHVWSSTYVVSDDTSYVI